MYMYSVQYHNCRFMGSLCSHWLISYAAIMVMGSGTPCYLGQQCWWGITFSHWVYLSSSKIYQFTIQCQATSLL